MSRIVCFFLALAAAAVPDSTGAQDGASFTAMVANPRIPLGEVGALELKVVGGEPEMVPRTIEVPGLEITYSGKQFHEQSTVINGRASIKLIHTYYYRIEGDQPGEYEIPSLSVTVNGETLRSSPVKLQILGQNSLKLSSAGPRFGILSVPKTDIYVNEIVPVDASVYVEGRHSIHSVNGAELKHESFVIKRFQKVDTEVVDIRAGIYTRARLPTTIFALKPGTHELGPASITVKVVENSSRFSMPSFFTQLRLRTVRSDAVGLNVRPLPSGAPDSFSGGVGSFEMEAQANPTRVKVGDPISLQFTIRGTGNFETMGAPIMPDLDPAVWKTYDPKKELRTESDGTSQGLCEFSQVLIPLKEVDEIPPFELTFFDPAVDQYVTRRTLPTRLVVEPDNSPTVAGMPVGPSMGGTGGGSVSAPVPSAEFPDILHIRKDRPRWRSYSASGRPPVVTWLTNAVLGVLFFGLIGVSTYRRMRRARAEKPRETGPVTFRAAAAVIRPGMERARFYRASRQALELWERENRDAPEDVRRVVRELKEKSETVLYGERGETLSAQTSVEEADRFLKVIQRLNR